MKTIRFLCLFGVLLFVKQQVSAQFGAGVHAGVFNSFGEGSDDAAFGLNLPARITITDEMNVGINLGVYFSRSQVLGITTTAYTAPLLATFEYKFGTNDFTPYASLDAGLYILGFSNNFGSGSGSEFGIAPGLGGLYEINRDIYFDASFKYHLIFTEGTTNSSALGANLGIRYYF